MKNKILASALALAFTLPFATLRAGEGMEKKEEAKSAAEGKEPMYMVACPSPCSFSVKSHDKSEVAAVIMAHAKSHHNMVMSEQKAEEMIKERHAKK